MIKIFSRVGSSPTVFMLGRMYLSTSAGPFIASVRIIPSLVSIA
jgi:hypothetical protein